MSDEKQQAVVRVNLHTGEIEVRGSEEFVERMLPTARAIAELKANAAPPPPQAVTTNNTPPPNANGATLADFIRDKGLSRATSGEDAMTAFLYFLTKVRRQDSASREQILDMFDQAGIPKPNNAPATLSNLKSRRGLLQSAGRGAYKLTVQGENFVAFEMNAQS